MAVLVGGSKFIPTELCTSTAWVSEYDTEYGMNYINYGTMMQSKTAYVVVVYIP